MVYIVGTGLPLLGGSLGKMLFAPRAHLITESGMADCNPVEAPSSVGDLRLMTTSQVLLEPYRYLGYQINTAKWRRNNLLAIIGGAQVDRYGNVNSTCIGDYRRPKVRFSGSGGANGIASFSNTIILIKHAKERFVERVDYVTSPGYGNGAGGRKENGLSPEVGPQCVVSDLGVMEFDPDTKAMYLSGYYAFTSPEEVQQNTSFQLDLSRAKPIDPPESAVLEALYSRLDPGGLYL